MIELTELLDAIIEFQSDRPGVKNKAGIEVKYMDKDGNNDYNVFIEMVEKDGKWYMEL